MALGKQVDVVHTYFSEAFHNIDIGILLEKIGLYSVYPENYWSSWPHICLTQDLPLFIPSSGVPQGSNLGLRFFFNISKRHSELAEFPYVALC